MLRISQVVNTPRVNHIIFDQHYVDADFSSRDIEGTVAFFVANGPQVKNGLYQFNGGVWVKL